jgi:hypothetical protein
MSKVLHVVKETVGRFQIRVTDSAGEGPGTGHHIELGNQQELESGLRGEGCTDSQVGEVLKQLEEVDNAEVRL